MTQPKGYPAVAVSHSASTLCAWPGLAADGFQRVPQDVSMEQATQLLADRVAVVTGGGGGIGAATAQLFAQHGAHVVIADIDAELAQRTAEEITTSGGWRCRSSPTSATPIRLPAWHARCWIGSAG